MYKLKIGDEILVLSGKDKSKKGKIEKVFKTKNLVLVPGINVYKRHRKATRNTPAGIHEISRPIETSKIQIICPKCGKPTRVALTVEGKTKNRICRKCKGVI